MNRKGRERTRIKRSGEERERRVELAASLSRRRREASRREKGGKKWRLAAKKFLGF